RHFLARQLYLIKSVTKLRKTREFWFLFRSSVRDWLASEIARDRFSHLLHRSKHVLRRAQAIHAYNVGTRVEQCFGRIRSALAFGRLILVLETDGAHRRQAGLLGTLYRDQSVSQPGERLADNEVHALIDSYCE